MSRVIGVDEAGYGPLLGPFTMVAVESTWAGPPGDLWERLAAQVRRATERSDGRIPVGDSKALHSSSKGITPLEKAVRPFLALADVRIAGWHELRSRLTGSDPEDLPWHQHDLELPMGEEESPELPEVDGLRSLRIEAVVLDPPRFNRSVTRSGNKSELLFASLVELIERIGVGGEWHIGKHGGKKFYADDFQQAFPMTPIERLSETPECSAYRIAHPDVEGSYTFWMDAENRRFEIGLASMVAKYLREVGMIAFNRFWQEHVEDLKPTAGYYEDGRRFLEEIEPARAELGIDPRLMVRVK
jgi:hypothetical protein